MMEMPLTPREPRPASTVILVRQHAAELQVYLLKRSGMSGFMPGNYVFPGGTLDPEDRLTEFWCAHADLPRREIERRLGGELSLDRTLAHAVTAIRETFEEAGILLGSHDAAASRLPTELCVLRDKRDLKKDWLRVWLKTGGWTLALGRLSRWAHWVTPAVRPQRYDTRFFLGLMPNGQTCRPDAQETTDGIWLPPEEALWGNLRGKIPLSPPTLVTLHELLPFRDLAELEAEWETRPWGPTRLPRALATKRGPLLLLPWDPLYGEEGKTYAEEMGEPLQTPGEPFSRLWYHENIWRPVRRHPA
jgi:8-oxo-dGTP pyrophosphatase MutT (NUDIX family)